MAYRIFWTPIAVQDLRDICDFISRDNPVAAQRMGEELIKQSEAQVSGFQRRLRKWSRQSVGSAGNALAPSQEVLVCRARRDSIDAHRKSGRGEGGGGEPLRCRFVRNPDVCPAA